MSKPVWTCTRSEFDWGDADGKGKSTKMAGISSVGVSESLEAHQRFDEGGASAVAPSSIALSSLGSIAHTLP